MFTIFINSCLNFTNLLLLLLLGCAIHGFVSLEGILSSPLFPSAPVSFLHVFSLKFLPEGGDHIIETYAQQKKSIIPNMRTDL